MPTVMITGANRGLGLEFAKQYAQEGWQVLACCRNSQSAQELADLAAQHKDVIKTFSLDVRDDRAIKSLKQQIGDTPIDVLINNAGVYLDKGKGFGELYAEDWLTTMDVNVVSPFRIAQAFANNVASSQQKKFVMMSSQMGSVEDNTSGASYLYRSSKAALNAASKSMSIDLQPMGITVIIMHPGWVLTDMGGPSALISTQQSIQGMRKVIADATIKDSGRFVAYDGRELAW